MKSEVDVKNILQTSIRQTEANIAFFNCHKNTAAKAATFNEATKKLTQYTEKMKEERKSFDDAFIADLLDRFENCLKIARTLPSHKLEKYKTRKGKKEFTFTDIISLDFLFELEFFLLHAEHPLSTDRRQQFLDIIKVNDTNQKKLRSDLETFCKTADAFLAQGHSVNNTKIIQTIRDEIKRQLSLLVTPEMIGKYYGAEYQALHRIYLLSEDAVWIEQDLTKYNDISDEKFAPLFKDYRRKFLGDTDKEMDSKLKRYFQVHNFPIFFHWDSVSDVLKNNCCKPPARVVVDLLKFVDLQNQQRLYLSKKGAFSLGKTGELIMDLWDTLLNALSTFTIEDNLMTSVELARAISVTPNMLKSLTATPQSSIVSQIALAGGSPVTREIKEEKEVPEEKLAGERLSAL